MHKVTISINGRKIQARAGSKILQVALDHGIYIPHLCDWQDRHLPFAACRLCFVEIEGKPGPVTACTELVADGLIIWTRSERVDQLVRSGFELIMSDHRLDCKNCSANGSCELQRIAKERKIPLKPKNLPLINKGLPVDNSKAGIIYDPGKCVLCGRCVLACREEGRGVLGFAGRGFDRILTTFCGQPLAKTSCNLCGACIKACPVGAMSAGK